MCRDRAGRGMKMSRRGNKHYRINAKKLIIFLAILVVIIAGAAVAVHMLSSNSYDSESSFQKYAGSYFGDVGDKQSVGDKQDSIKYGEPLSTAAETPKLDMDVSNSTISMEVKTEKAAFDTDYSGLNTDAKEKACLLIGYSSHKTPYKVQSVAMTSVIEQNKDGSKDMSVKSGVVHTYNFSTKSGVSIGAAGVFKGGYGDTVAPLVQKKLDKAYGDKLKDGWKDKVSKTSGAFSNFVLTKSGITFYFDQASLIKYDTEDNGIASCSVSYDDLSKVLRDDIGKRVIDPKKKMVAFTFDDGPSEYTNDLLDVFEKYDAVGTFFELGQNVDNLKGASKILKRELSVGCEVGCHSYDHPYFMDTISKSKAKKEVEKGCAAIKKACGQDPTVFRPPGGEIDKKTEAIVGLPSILWSVDSLDWSNRNTAKTVANVMKAGNLDGKVVLMHSLYPSTVRAVNELVPKLEAKGYQFVTVSEMIQYRYNETVDNNKIYGYNYFYYDGHGGHMYENNR